MPTSTITAPSSPSISIPGELLPPVVTLSPMTMISPVASTSTPGESSPRVTMSSKTTLTLPSPPSTSMPGELSPSVSTSPTSTSIGPGLSTSTPGESSPSVSISGPAPVPGPPGPAMVTLHAPAPRMAQAVGSVSTVIPGELSPTVETTPRFATTWPGALMSTAALSMPWVVTFCAVRFGSQDPAPSSTHAAGSLLMSIPVAFAPSVSTVPKSPVMSAGAAMIAPAAPSPPVEI